MFNIKRQIVACKIQVPVAKFKVTRKGQMSDKYENNQLGTVKLASLLTPLCLHLHQQLLLWTYCATIALLLVELSILMQR